MTHNEDTTPSVPNHDSTAPASANPPANHGRSPRKTVAIAGAAVAALLIAGGAGAAIANGFDTPGTSTSAGTSSPDVGTDDISSTPQSSQPTETPQPSSTPSSTTATTIGVTSSEEILSYLSTATEVAPGTPVSIEASRDGSWYVEIEDEQRTETTVRINTDGSATVVEVDRQDDSQSALQGTLSKENIDTLIEVVTAQVSGTIVGLSVDDDTVFDAYSADVLSTDGASITEFELDTSFAVTEWGIDDLERARIGGVLVREDRHGSR